MIKNMDGKQTSPLTNSEMSYILMAEDDKMNNKKINLKITKQTKTGKIITFGKTIECLESLKDIISKQAGVLAVYDIDNGSVLYNRMYKDKRLSQQGTWMHLEKYNVANAVTIK